MNISLPESLREYVERQVAERGYTSASEFVRELIRDSRERSSKEVELRELVQLGLEQLRRDESIEFDEASIPEFFAEVKSRARAKFSKQKTDGE